MSNVTNFPCPVADNTNIRVVMIDDEPWFVAKDVCEVLELGWDRANQVYAPSRLLKYLNEDEKASNRIANKGQHVKIINESGLYKLIMRSDKPQAKPFQDWVTRDVLPAIRKDGMYVMGEEKVASGEMSEDELILKAVTLLQAKVERLTAENAKMSHHFEYMTVDRFVRFEKGAYTKPNENISLGKRASALSKDHGVKLEKEHRTLRKRGQTIDTYINVYPIQYLQEAWVDLGFDRKYEDAQAA